MSGSYNAEGKEGIHVKCVDCEQEWLLRPADIKQSKLRNANDRIVVSFFPCPRCGKAYIIAVMDDKCISIKERYIAAIDELKDLIAIQKAVKLDKQRQLRRAKIISSKQDVAKQIGDELDDAMNDLKSKYNGEFTLDADADEDDNCILFVPHE